MKKILSLFLFLFVSMILSSCMTTVGPNEAEVEKKINEMQALKPQAPSNPLDPELKKAEKEFEKAYNFLNSKIVGKDNIIKAKEYFPKVSLRLVKQTPFIEVSNQIYKETGWKLKIKLTDRDIPYLKRQILSGKNISRDLVNVLNEIEKLKTAYSKYKIKLAQASAVQGVAIDKKKETNFSHELVEASIPLIFEEKIQIPASDYDYVSLAELVYDVSNEIGLDAYADFNTKTIVFTNTLTKTFYLPIIAGTDEVSMKNSPSSLGEIGGSTGGQGQGGGSSSSEQAGQFEFKIKKRNIIESVKKSIAQLIAQNENISEKEAEKYVIINEPSSEITVTAPIETMIDIEKMIKRLIKDFSTQVEVYVTILEVDWNSQKDRSNFFNYLKTNSNDQYSLTLGKSGSAVDTLLSFAFKRTNPEEAIDFIVNMSNQFGKSKILANMRTLTQNGYPVTLFSGRIIEYVESYNINLQLSGQVITPQTNTVSDGLTLHIIPKVVDDHHILFIITPRMASVTFQEYKYGDQTMELPISRVHQQYVRFISEDSVVNIFGGIQYGTIEKNSIKTAIFNIPMSASNNSERRDVFFILCGKIVDLSGYYENSL